MKEGRKENEQKQTNKKELDSECRFLLHLIPRLRWKKDNHTSQGKKIYSTQLFFHRCAMLFLDCSCIVFLFKNLSLTGFPEHGFVMGLKTQEKSRKIILDFLAVHMEGYLLFLIQDVKILVFFMLEIEHVLYYLVSTSSMKFQASRGELLLEMKGKEEDGGMEEFSNGLEQPLICP